MSDRFRAVSLATAIVACVAGCGSSSSRPSAASTSTASVHTTATTTTSAAAAPRRHRRHHTPNPGSLPQTDGLPSSHTRAFRSEMAALWRAIRTGLPREGRIAFFPAAAYAQVKAVADPQSDFQQRLVGDYNLDIAAAHGLLGAHADRARLLAVSVPDAHWVDPGACYNRIGYYEVPNARIVYRTDTGVNSFGIASMISWRGTWYVIHLGAVVRTAAAGVVDAPSSGPGSSTPSYTC